ncbi:MAG: hypothetical protein NT062_19255 [Proteobacteria bacterium]|nr:hypothetical protein [Pseudomonadota bacterium]
MFRIAMVALLVAGAACHDEKTDRLRAIRAEVCACKTSACADAALKAVPKEQAPSNRRTQAVAREMLDCLAKLHDADRPADDP